MTCACGALSASGRPWRPTVHWRAASGGGWTELDDEDEDEATGSHGPDDEAARRRIGY